MSTKYLARELEKYYQRIGNRIIFSNEMSLNQLAWEMWEKMGYEGMDPSVLSKVLKGERLFTKKQLKMFGQIICLSGAQLENLNEKLYSDILSRYGLGGEFFAIKNRYFLELVGENLKKISSCLDNGLPTVALDWANHLCERVEEEILVTSSNDLRSTLFESLATAIVKKNDIQSHILKANEFYKNTLRVYSKLIHMGQRVKNNHIIGLANIRLSSACYVNKHYRKSVGFALEGFNAGITSQEAALPLRESAICYSKIGESTEFNNVKKKIFDRIGHYDDNIRYQMLEGMARAEANLGHFGNAYKALGLAIDTLPKSYGPMKAVQLIAAEMELGILSGSGDKNYLSGIGNLGLDIAKSHGYKRHEEKLGERLKKILE